MIRGAQELAAKIERYERFIDETLRVKLSELKQQRSDILSEMEGYERLGSSLKMLRDENMATMKASVNVGCDLYMQAVVPDTSMVMIDVGLGFFAEMTQEEGIAFVDKRVAALQDRANDRGEELASISSQIDVVLQGISELMSQQ